MSAGSAVFSVLGTNVLDDVGESIRVVVPVAAASIEPRGGDPLALIGMCHVVFAFLQELIESVEELSLPAFLEKRLVLTRPFSQKEATTGWDFDAPCRLEITRLLAKKAQVDRGRIDGLRIVFVSEVFTRYG